MSDPTKDIEDRMKEITNEINLRIWPNDHLIEMIEGHLTEAREQARRGERERWEKLCREHLSHPKAKTGSWQAEWHGAYEELMHESKKGGVDG